MRRIIQASGLVLVILLVLGTFVQVGAQSDPTSCGPYGKPGTCTPPFHRGDQLFIREGMPFVWLRAMPSSSGHIVVTVRPAGGPVLQVVSYPPQWDGSQYWYFVMPIGNSLVNGWVEQVSLRAGPTMPPTPVVPPRAPWIPPLTATLQSWLPFGWFRFQPSSYAAHVYTVYPGMVFTVMDTPAATYDGVQWWWPVRIPISGSTVSGWLEQGAIRPSATSNCSANTAPRLIIGQTAYITPGAPNGLRSTPSTSGLLIGKIPGGSAVRVLAGPVCDGQLTWWQVAYQGQTGWTPESDGKTYFISGRYSTITPPRLASGRIAYITPGAPNSLRTAPSISAPLIGKIPGGSIIQVLAGPVCDWPFTWWRVAYQGQIGWTAESDGYTYFIVPG